MKRLVSGIQPTGIITLGNYLGALRNFVKLQDELSNTEFFIFIADLHAITTPQEGSLMRKNIKNLAALYLACGLDPTRVNLFIQSEVVQHAQLGYIMECTGYIGELERMTQFKDKKQKQTVGVSVSLLTYPALMAADILLYDANLVPVGEDQKQHIELTRDLANRFNQRFGDVFAVPEPYIPKVGARIMSLTDPLKKMSKSDENPKSYINLLDDLAVIKNKIKGAVTDLDAEVRYDVDKKPGISNLMTIYSLISHESFETIEARYVSKGYKEFKEDLADLVVSEIQPIQERYKSLLLDGSVDAALDKGALEASKVAYKKIQKVYQKMGLGRKK